MSCTKCGLSKKEHPHRFSTYRTVAGIPKLCNQCHSCIYEKRYGKKDKTKPVAKKHMSCATCSSHVEQNCRLRLKNHVWVNVKNRMKQIWCN